MNPPLISIIIPALNSIRTLPETLKSIANQKFRDYEVIVVDGGSTDGLVKLLNDYHQYDARIKFISEKDSGIYDGMNKGITMSTGSWLLFLGSDDRLYNDQVFTSVSDSLKLPENNVVYGNVCMVGDSSWAKDNQIYDGPFDLAKILNKNICHQCIFYRSDFVKKEIGLYNTEYRLCADWDFNLRCFAKTKFTYLQAIIAFFHGGGLSTRSTDDEKFSKDFLANILKYFGLTVFDPVVNNAGLNRLHEVLAEQKKTNKWKYWLNRIKFRVSALVSRPSASLIL